MKVVNMQEIENVAEEFGLKFVILYGSQAREEQTEESDIDIAVLGNEVLNFDTLIDLNDKFSQIFNVNNIDVKSLHFASPLFRFEVVKDGVLLYGSARDFESFKNYAYKSYIDGKDLLGLKKYFIRKRLNINV